MPQQQHSHSMLSEASYHNMTVGRIPSVEGGIQPTLLTTKGDIIVATGNATLVRQGVGSDNQVLMADSAQADGVKYANEATATLTTTGDLLYASAANTLARRGIGSEGQVLSVSSGVPTWTTAAGAAQTSFSLLNAGGTTLTGATTITVSGISNRSKILIHIREASASTFSNIQVRLNTDTGSNYFPAGIYIQAKSAYSATEVFDIASGGAASSITMGRTSGTQASILSGYLLLDGCNTSGVKAFSGAASGNSSGNSDQAAYAIGGIYNSATAISSISLVSSSGNFDGGTVFVYTSA